MSKILFLNETDRNASYKTEYRYKTAKQVKAAKPKRDEAGFIIPYAMFRPIREPGLICELLGDTPVRRSADLKMNLDYLMKEAYEHAIEQIMCSVRLQEIRCQMQFNAEDRAWEHYTRLREKGQYAVMPSVTVEERRRVILAAITWKYDWIQKHKKWCFQFADAVITREKNGGTESQSQFIEKFIQSADSLPEANRRLLDRLYEAAWEIIQIYRYDADPCHVPAPWYPHYYRKEDLTVEVVSEGAEPKTVTAMVYIMENDFGEREPNSYYYRVLYEGYKAFHFPMHVLEGTLKKCIGKEAAARMIKEVQHNVSE